MDNSPSEQVDKERTGEEDEHSTLISQAEAHCKEANALLEQEDLHENTIVKARELFMEALSIDFENVLAMIGLAYVNGLLSDHDAGFELLKKAKGLLAENDPLQQDIDEMESELKEMRLEEEQEEEDEDEERDQEGESSEEEEQKETGGQLEGKQEQEESSSAISSVAQSSEKNNTQVTLVEKDTLTQPFYEALYMVFAHFDQDSDEAWSPEELNQFHIAVNGAPASKETLTFFKSNFPCTRKGFLTLEGFLAFYFAQASEDPEETWKDLHTLGFDSQLHVIDERYKHLQRVPVQKSGRGTSKRKGK